MYTVTYRKEAIKCLRKMAKKDARRFLAAFEKIAKKETKGLNIKQFGQLKNSYRLRIGNYRALYSIYENDLVIVVVKLGVHGDIYIMKHQVIKKSGKPEYAVLPYKEYEKLLQLAEDAEDIRALLKAAKHDEERLPHTFVKELINSEQPLPVWRKYRGLSQQELADSSGVAQAYIAQIESGKKEGSIKTLKKLATALSITMDDLVTD